jgi:protein-disulfide isomerase
MQKEVFLMDRAHMDYAKLRVNFETKNTGNIMNIRSLNYITIKIALCLSIFITQANAEGLPKEFNIKEDDIVLGNVNSEVVLIEYYAPTCGPCANADRNIFPVIKEKYIDTGKIAYVMREFVGNKQDLDASILARCDGSTAKYIQFKSIILSKQDDWAFGTDYRQRLESFAKLGGISKEQYETCLNSDALVKTLIENTQIAANLHNFIGTPSFFINGKLLDVRQGITANSIIQEIDKILN